MDSNVLKKMQLAANNIRRNIIQVAFNAPGDGAHISPALSMVEILTFLYYSKRLFTSDTDQHDSFILSKGHGALALYATLYEFNVISKEDLDSFECNGSIFQGHPARHILKGIEFTGGSLAQGLSFGCGFALNRKLKQEQWQTFILVGDGECNEGAIWEGAFFAAQHKLENIIVIVDVNGLQSDGNTSNILNLALVELWSAAGWKTIECNGHNFTSIIEAFSADHKCQPKVILAHTIKGKGVSYMENNKDFHRNKLTKNQYETAMAELESYSTCQR